MAGIFKAYDIRGVYGSELTEELAEKIGRAFVTFLKCTKVVIGRDMRPHSKPLFDALAQGITMQGADVVDLGMVSTPMSYYANGLLGADAGIMLTASHNPGEYNGFKLSRAGAVPISGDTGIGDVERIVSDASFDPPAANPGKVTSYDIIDEYIAHIRKHVALERPVKVVIDYANAMGIYEGKVLDGIFDITPMYDELDGSFPNHEANPLDVTTLEDLQAEVAKGGYDFGIAFDGDADRTGFVDDKGNIVPMDIITALVAQDLMGHEKGVILYDLRSSWAVKEVIEESGGTAMMSRVGHAFIKQQMRENNAIFAGELSGHYYFRDNYFTESSSLAAICVANIVSRSGKPLSELVKPIIRYVASGEINTKLDSREKALATMSHLKATYGPLGRCFELDGISVELENWWFNVRMSNTEPLLRLNLEAKNHALMVEKRDELLAIIRA